MSSRTGRTVLFVASSHAITLLAATGFAQGWDYVILDANPSGGFRNPQGNGTVPGVSVPSTNSIGPNNTGGGAWGGGMGAPNQMQSTPNIQPGANTGPFNVGQGPFNVGQGSYSPMQFPGGTYGGSPDYPSFGPDYQRPGGQPYDRWAPQQTARGQPWREEPYYQPGMYVPGKDPDRTVGQRYSFNDVTSRSQPHRPIPRDSTPVILISNPASNSATVAYAINGKQYSLEPGSQHEIVGKISWTIEFDRGNGVGRARYSLREGNYKFSRKERQWNFYRIRQPDMIARTGR